MDIGVAGFDRQGLADFALGEHIGAAGGTRDGDALSTPLVADVA